MAIEPIRDAVTNDQPAQFASAGIQSATLARLGWDAGWARNPTSHISTISLTISLRRASWNAMKPRIQCVLTQ